jgi:hypothetical protein
LIGNFIIAGHISSETNAERVSRTGRKLFAEAIYGTVRLQLLPSTSCLSLMRHSRAFSASQVIQKEKSTILCLKNMTRKYKAHSSESRSQGERTCGTD